MLLSVKIIVIMEVYIVERPVTTLFMPMSVDGKISLDAVAGKEAVTLIDGDSIMTSEHHSELGVLELERRQTLENSYIRLTYRVIS